MTDQPGQAVRTQQGFFAQAVSGTGDPDDGFGAVAAQLRRRLPAARTARLPAPAAPPPDQLDEDPERPAPGEGDGDTPPAGTSDPSASADQGPAQPPGGTPSPESDSPHPPAPPGNRRRREDPATATLDIPAPTGRAPRTRAEGRNVPVVLQLSSELAARAKAHCRDHKITHADLVFLAVDASSEHLAASAPQPGSASSLFTPQRPTREHSESSLTQFPAQMRAANVDVLDQLAERYGIGSRSALVRTCIAAYLDGAHPSGS